MAYRKVDETSLTAVANAIRTKGGTTDPLAFPDGFVSAVEGIQAGGGSGGIGAIKFVDEDITVETSTSTAAKYTIDGVEFPPTSIDNPTKWNAFSANDVYICFITPKSLDGDATGGNYSRNTMITIYGMTNYGRPVTGAYSTFASTDPKGGYGGFNSAGIEVESVVDGKIMGHVWVQTKTNNTNILAGTYNVQFWMLTVFDWGL